MALLQALLEAYILAFLSLVRWTIMDERVPTFSVLVCLPNVGFVFFGQTT